MQFSQRNARPSWALALGLATSGALVAAGPCDSYAKGNTPCVAAHSTTRALYDAFTGSLYQVKRGSDGATTDIAPVSAGGVADAGRQDRFCAGTTCVITVIYDQSKNNNHLTQAPGGDFAGPEANRADNLASAIGAPVQLFGNKKAYGVFIAPGTGYRNNAAQRTARGDAAQGMYAVVDGTHFNGGCCFDYGNAETSTSNTGNGHMEAIYFGDSTAWGSGSGSGPWVMADLENGLAVVKGGPNKWAVRAGDATAGDLSTFYSGVRPAGGYDPMKKEGAIILGIGGDNSVSAQGTFYEGVMTSGYPSDATEKAVQDDIVAAGYKVTPLSSGPQLSVGARVSLRATSSCCTTRYMAHTSTGGGVDTQVVSSSSAETLRKQATWTVRTGLGNSGCFSFESVSNPGSFIRHNYFVLRVDADDGSKSFREDATFCTEAGLNGQGSSIRAWGHPTRYIRHFANVGYVASNGGVQTYDAAREFNNDVSWVVGAGFS
ncbi:hypothetical protein BN1723_016243 [Verticillium longisporum]|uniref:Alpha-L-arabinofuranosidase n=1 Tax=Verticillium longisporum TaxID=100787 RepID=A0A0G4NB66_VERLO|nr:hypothetical protein BN1723_016243 [Verticillium longisporum]